jgi:undecaprenyl-diphosphatase
MNEADAPLTAWINSYAGHFAAIDDPLIWLSAIGVPALVAAVAVQWWFPRPDRHTRHVIVAAGLSFLLGLGLNQVILLFVQRVRPYDAHVTHLLIAPSADFSFPSDHATASVAIAAAFWVHGLRGRGGAFLAAATLLAFSRVYVGTHYVGDVLGGAVTGIIAAILVRVAYREGSRLDRFVTSIL